MFSKCLTPFPELWFHGTWKGVWVERFQVTSFTIFFHSAPERLNHVWEVHKFCWWVAVKEMESHLLWVKKTDEQGCPACSPLIFSDPLRNHKALISSYLKRPLLLKNLLISTVSHFIHYIPTSYSLFCKTDGFYWLSQEPGDRCMAVPTGGSSSQPACELSGWNTPRV